MKVKVKDISVYHSGASFQSGDVLSIDPKDYRDTIFEVVDEKEETPETPEEVDESDLNEKTVKELKDMAKEHNISGSGRMGKDKLIEALSEVK